MRTNIAVVIVSLLFLIPATSSASSRYDSSSRDFYPGKVYLGVKYGNINALDLLIFNPATGMDQEEDAEIGTVGLVFGGSINDYMAMEFEYNSTVSKEYYDSLPGRLEAEGWGLYLVAKSLGDLYVKGRLGYTEIEFDGNDGSTGSGSVTNYGVAGSVGVGYKIGPGALEVEYTLFPDIERIWGEELDDDIETEMITIGYMFTYD